MEEHPRKLGLLAGTFEDGSLSIYVVPDPEDVRNKDDDPMRPTFGGCGWPCFEIIRTRPVHSAFTRATSPHRARGHLLLVS